MSVLRSPLMSRWIGAVFLLVTLAGCAVTPRGFHSVDPIAPDRVSHQVWEQIVQAHVQNGQVGLLQYRQQSARQLRGGAQPY